MRKHHKANALSAAQGARARPAPPRASLLAMQGPGWQPSWQACRGRGLVLMGSLDPARILYRIRAAFAIFGPISVATRILFDQDPGGCHFFARILQGLLLVFARFFMCFAR